MRKSRVRTLKRFLLLLVRLGIVLTAVLIFLQPFNRRDPFATLRNPDAAVYAYIDPTVSMDYRDHGATLWHNAFGMLDSLDKMLSPAAQRLLYDDARREFVVQDAFSAPPRAFSRHGPSGCSRMMAAFAEAEGRHGRGRGMPVLIAMSDFQEAESRTFDTVFSQHMLAPVACVSTAPDDPWDFRVTNVGASNDNYSTVNARVECIGRGLKNASLSASIGGMRVGHASVTVDEGKHADISLPVTADISQPAGTVRLEADDPFPADNEGFFIRGTSRAVRVLIAGDPYESFPLAAAFAGLGPSQWTVIHKKENDVTFGDIDSAALIVLCGVRHPSAPIDLLIHGRSFGPKAILFSPIMDSSSLFVNNEVLPAIGRRTLSLSAAASASPHSLELPDTLTALFAGFPRLTDPDARVYRHCDGLPGSAIVRLDNGQPLFTGLIDTLGNSWVIAATSLGLTPQGQNPANNLSETGIYVALLDRLGRFALSAIHHEPQSWTAGIAIRNPYLGSKGGALVFDARNRLVATWSRQPSVVFDEPGCYRIQPQAEPAYWVCVEIDSSETLFSYRFPVVGRQNRNVVRCMTAGEFMPFVKTCGRGAVSPWLWAALGLLLIAEVLLWEKKPAQPSGAP